jgi:hypothetical protein
MYARASPSFHGNPWHSDVAIQMEPKGLPEEIEYVQLWLFFKVDLLQTSNNTLVIKELALVCMDQKVPPNRLSCLTMKKSNGPYPFGNNLQDLVPCMKWCNKLEVIA